MSAGLGQIYYYIPHNGIAGLRVDTHVYTCRSCGPAHTLIADFVWRRNGVDSIPAFKGGSERRTVPAIRGQTASSLLPV
jgi:hypothetical protein